MKASEIVARVEALEADVARLRRTHGAKYLLLEDAAAMYGFKLATLKDYVFRQRKFTKYRQGDVHGRGRAGGRVVLAVKELDVYMERRRDTVGDRLKTVRSA